MIKIHHIAIYVQDLEGVSRFFETYFEVQKIDLYHTPKTHFRSRMLHFAEGPSIELMTRPEIQSISEAVQQQSGLSSNSIAVSQVGYHHLSFSLGSIEAVDTLTARLWDDGYRILSGPRTTGDGYYESCIAGPEEIIIELTV